MKFIVTGGAGFIGSHIVERLVKEGKEVVVIDNLSTGKKENISSFLENITFVQGSITDKSLLDRYIAKDDIIFHQAALPSVVRSVDDPITSNHVNITGSLNVLQSAKEKGAKRVVFASSSSVYGDSETLPKIETMTPNPKSPYALSKLTVEYYLKIFYQLYGLETVSLRYFNIFGPRQDPFSDYSAVIPKFASLMLQGKVPTIFGDGKQSRDFTYIDNAVDANIRASVSEKAVGQIINVACGDRIDLLKLIEKINGILGTTIIADHAGDRQGDVKHSLADIKKAKELLGYQLLVNMDDGLKKTIEALR